MRTNGAVDLDKVIQENVDMKNLLETIRPELVCGFLARGYGIYKVQELDLIKAIDRLLGRKPNQGGHEDASKSDGGV